MLLLLAILLLLATIAIIAAWTPASVCNSSPSLSRQVFGISAFFQEAKKGGSSALDGIGAGGGMGFGAGGGGVASNRSKVDFEKGKK